jgi:hypothetical protein
MTRRNTAELARAAGMAQPSGQQGTTLSSVPGPCFRKAIMKHMEMPKRAALATAMAACLFFIAADTLAQGTFGPLVVLRTGMGGPVLSSTQTIGSFSIGQPASLQFTFGFSTDEQTAPGTFFDSLTLTLGEANGSLSVIYNTTDRTGSYWGPPAPGAIFISPDSIVRQSIAFPDLDPVHTNQFAYLVTAPVPNELLGRNLNFYMDLFDNQNGIDSLGWVSVAPVPEPSTWALAATALVMFFAFTWRSK